MGLAESLGNPSTPDSTVNCNLWGFLLLVFSDLVGCTAAFSLSIFRFRGFRLHLTRQVVFDPCAEGLDSCCLYGDTFDVRRFVH